MEKLRALREAAVSMLAFSLFIGIVVWSMLASAEHLAEHQARQLTPRCSAPFR